MLNIRRAVATDAAKICSCTVNAFKDYMVMIGRTPGPMLEDYWVAIHEHHVFVAEINGKFSGFSLIKDGDDDCMWLDVLAVEMNDEGQGVGTALLKHAESFILSKGKKKCRLYTHVKYVRAQKLYLRHGYEIYQRVQEDGFDRYYLEKQLDGQTVCDECHTSGMDEIISICLKSESADPIEIMEQMMSMPSCHMHGPEHHTMVGSALLTAYRNAGGDIDLKDALYEMQVRGKQVPGGACGLWGACGAGVSTGMYVSIALKTTPLSEKTWGLSNQMTARALSAIGKNGGP